MKLTIDQVIEREQKAFAKVRVGEMVGSGYFVARRGMHSKRLRWSRKPFEHASLDAAKAEAQRLAKLHPHNTFEVFSSAAIYHVGDE